VNHEGSLEKAFELIDLAKKGGASAVKFQSYKAHTLASKNSPAYWDTKKEPMTSQYKLFQKYDNFGEDEFIKLYEYSNEKDIDFLSTPFDDESIDFLDPLMPFFKIASADITNLPFLRKVSLKGKPIILSTGASNAEEIELAINTIIATGNEEISLLHCILNYPTQDENAHLNMILGLKKLYPNKIIGYSDHTIPDKSMTTLVCAYLLGALIIEKHFTHDKSLQGNDHYHAMDVHDLSVFKSTLGKIISLRGRSEKKEPIALEEKSRLYARRSIVLINDLSSGNYITEDHITYKRPGTGISPIHWDEVIGKKLISDKKSDDILYWEDIEK
jgi:sialic acid synthase SpsE